MYTISSLPNLETLELRGIEDYGLHWQAIPDKLLKVLHTRASSAEVCDIKCLRISGLGPFFASEEAKRYMEQLEECVTSLILGRKTM